MPGTRYRWTEAAPFGLALAAALFGGVVACLRLPALAPVAWAVAALLVGVALWWRGGWPRCIGAALCGFALASLHASAALSLRLPATLEGADLVAKIGRAHV